MGRRLLQYGALALLFHLASGCDRPASSPPETKDQPKDAANGPAKANDAPLVLVFGDSLYAGYGLDQGKGFAPTLERALADGGIPARVVNGGVSGDTSAAALARLAFTLDGLPRKPDLVLVGLGGNDMLRGFQPEATRANIDAILTELDRRGIDAMLTGMLAAPNLGADYAASFNALYPALARRHDAPLYPFFLDGVVGRPALMLPDGIHPNAQGVQTIVAKIRPLVGMHLQRTNRE